MGRRRCCCVTETPGTWRVYVQGCAGASPTTVTYNPTPFGGLDGVVCELYSDPGRTVLVASGVTDSVGRLDLAVPPGTYYPRITHPSSRFLTYDAASFTLASGGGANRGYAIAYAPGYFCIGCCKLPIKDVLSVSCPWGSTTMTLSGGEMVGYVTFDWPGNVANACEPGPVTIKLSLSDSCGVTFSFFYELNENNGGWCPTGGTNQVIGWTPTPTSLACPPAFSSSGTRTVSFYPNPAGWPPGYQPAMANLFNAGSGTFWYTVTE